VVGYLRNAHFYCHWCGRKYEDSTALDAECPGETFDDH
jgi:hypothetical protein